MKTLACCYGTRPEFIKIAPIVLELQRTHASIKPLLICSGQHEELLDGLDTAFGVRVIRSLDIRKIIGPTDSLRRQVFSLLSRRFISIFPYFMSRRGCEHMT
jgi:UDP-N-acetylglucosamine 2-epimerase